MKFFQHLTATVAAAALLGATGVAMAAPAGHDSKAGKCMPHQLKQQLQHLTKEQRAEVFKTLKQGREKTRDIRHQLHAKRIMLNALLLEKNAEPAKVNSVVNEISALQKQLLQTAVNTRMTIAKQSGVTYDFPAKKHDRKKMKQCHKKYRLDRGAVKIQKQQPQATQPN